MALKFSPLLCEAFKNVRFEPKFIGAGHAFFSGTGLEIPKKRVFLRFPGPSPPRNCNAPRAVSGGPHPGSVLACAGTRARGGTDEKPLALFAGPSRG